VFILGDEIWIGIEVGIVRAGTGNERVIPAAGRAHVSCEAVVGAGRSVAILSIMLFVSFFVSRPAVALRLPILNIKQRWPYSWTSRSVGRRAFAAARADRAESGRARKCHPK